MRSRPRARLRLAASGEQFAAGRRASRHLRRWPRMPAGEPPPVIHAEWRAMNSDRPTVPYAVSAISAQRDGQAPLSREPLGVQPISGAPGASHG